MVTEINGDSICDYPHLLATLSFHKCRDWGHTVGGAGEGSVTSATDGIVAFRLVGQGLEGEGNLLRGGRLHDATWLQTGGHGEVRLEASLVLLIMRAKDVLQADSLESNALFIHGIPHLRQLRPPLMQEMFMQVMIMELTQPPTGWGMLP